MYIHEETIAGDTIVARNHQSARWHKNGIKRSPNVNKTTETQETANKNRDIWELTIRLNANFKPFDYYLTFTYKQEERPDTIAEAKKDRTDLLRRLRRIYKKNGSELKFIAVTEFGKGGALHHHIVMNADVDFRDIARVWEKGWIDLKPMQRDGNYVKVANYFVKGRKAWKEAGGKGRMWTCSKNLKRPRTHRRIVAANAYLKTPKPKKGYYLDKDSLREGINADGWPFQSYILVKARGGPP